MKSITYGSVTYYNLTEGATVPDWLSQKKKGEIAKEQRRKKVEVLQDLGFKNGAPNCIEMTDDRNYMWMSGYYPSQIRCYDLNEVGLKFSRHLESEIVSVAPISTDYRKVAFLLRDRWLEFHNQGGRHTRLRVPKEGRAMVYDKRTASVIVPTSCSSVYHVDMDTGCFLEPAVTEAEANDCVAVCPAHPLLAVGGTNGKVECIDLRCPNKSVAVLDVASGVAAFGGDGFESDSSSASSAASFLGRGRANAVTSLCFDDTGMTLLAGTSQGVVGVYDIRKRTPTLVKDHNNTLPMRKMMFHSCFGKKQAATADTKGIKVWDYTTGENFISVDTSHELYSFAIPQSSEDRGSGVILATCDSTNVNAFFVPQLGPAPQWCSYLETLTEELEEQAGHEAVATGFDDYKFVTREELERLHLSHLLKGDSDQIQPYMHGFYIDLNLYRTTKAVMDPHEWREFQRSKRLAQKDAEDRITVVKKKRDLLKPVADDKPAAGGGAGRFALDGKSDKFQVDKDSDAYLKYNPNERQKRRGDLGDAFRPVEEDEDDGADSDGASSGLSDTAPSRGVKRAAAVSAAAPKMYELKEGRSILETERESHRGRKRAKEEKLTLGERLKRKRDEEAAKPAEAAAAARVRTADGGQTKEISFTLQPKRVRTNSSSFAGVEDDEGGDSGDEGGKGGKRRSFGGKGGGKKGGKGGKGKGGGKGGKGKGGKKGRK
eukprot:Rhum_TRINITY_DN1760_c0_g1::Rhum_TRINITY_DN1760_c0_g1_i1::g.4857::m.4857/K14788/NOL10, ENP2; ribosome biogenesis protein ENP2